MPNPSTSPQLGFTAEQLFKLTGQHLRLWSRAQGLDKVYPQAAELAELIDNNYRASPQKFLAQLYLHKPHFDHPTNLTTKAVIFATHQVNRLNWSRANRTSIIAATLTCNFAVLAILFKKGRGDTLDEKQKRALGKSGQLSAQLLKRHSVFDSLWLHAVQTSAELPQQRQCRIGLHGSIIKAAYRFAAPLCRAKAVDSLTVGQVLRQLYLDDCSAQNTQITDNAAGDIHNFSSGALTRLNNGQAALVIERLGSGQFLSFVFAGQSIGLKGRFAIIGSKHIVKSLPLYQCDQPKLYSQLWEGPLQRFLADKELTLNHPFSDSQWDIFTPPTMLRSILSLLFDQPELKKIAEAVDSSTELMALLKQSATEASAQKLPIHDTRHALAMLGLNRIGPLLTQGALRELLKRCRFAGRSWVDSRLDCFLHCVRFYAAFNDLVLAEEIALYACFYLAPMFIDKNVHSQSHKLYAQQHLEVREAFLPQRLLSDQVNEKHAETALQLADSWQLPKLCTEVFRLQENLDDTLKCAKKPASILAAIRIATFHCHTLFNQVDVNNAWLQQHLRLQLRQLNLTFEQFLSMQDDFLTQYQPYTPLF